MKNILINKTNNGAYLIGLVFVYFMFCFFELNWNPLGWSIAGRSFSVVCCLLLLKIYES